MYIVHSCNENTSSATKRNTNKKEHIRLSEGLILKISFPFAFFFSFFSSFESLPIVHHLSFSFSPDKNNFLVVLA